MEKKKNKTKTKQKKIKAAHECLSNLAYQPTFMV